MIKEGHEYKHYKNGKIYTLLHIYKGILIQNSKGIWESEVNYYERGEPMISFVMPLSEFEEKFKECEE